jgi:hypothetical protein
MPSVSKKQHNFMAAVAKNPGFAKKVGIPRSVGQEFLTADKGKKFGDGGAMKKKMRKFMDGGLSGEAASAGASMGSAAAKKLKQGDLSDLKKAAMGAGLSAGQMAGGLGRMLGKGATAGLSSMGSKKYEAPNDDSDYKKGGKVHSDIAKDKPMMKKVAAKAVKGHEKRMHGMAKGGGIEVKGKTKGKMIKMAKGGRAC